MHFIRQEVEKGTIKLGYMPTNEMPADGLTKPLTATKHLEFIELIGMEVYSL